MSQHNLFAALRAAFPRDLEQTAVQTETGLCYSWRDLDRASARIATASKLAWSPAIRVLGGWTSARCQTVSPSG